MGKRQAALCSKVTRMENKKKADKVEINKKASQHKKDIAALKEEHGKIKRRK